MSGVEDREQAILDTLPLARVLALKLARRYNLDYDEAIGDAYVGAVEAVDDYRDDKGATLATYAGHRIRSAVLDGMRARSWRPKADKRPDRAPLPQRNLVAIDDALDVADPHTDEAFEEAETRVVVQHIVLTIAADRHGQHVLDHHLHGRTLRAIGADLGVTESRASQIVTASCRRIRTALGESA